MQKTAVSFLHQPHFFVFVFSRLYIFVLDCACIEKYVPMAHRIFRYVVKLSLYLRYSITFGIEVVFNGRVSRLTICNLICLLHV